MIVLIFRGFRNVISLFFISYNMDFSVEFRRPLYYTNYRISCFHTVLSETILKSIFPMENHSIINETLMGHMKAYHSN